jgi:hypothetical protein
MANDKVCPKCSGAMRPTVAACTLPALSPGNPDAAKNFVFPIVPYACLECHYVELYYLPQS